MKTLTGGLCVVDVHHIDSNLINFVTMVSRRLPADKAMSGDRQINFGSIRSGSGLGEDAFKVLTVT
ncbi:hypothetical protein IQ268_26290 [Oculatella sp. LEGE 06141]|uniref:hypothetical protein n=1 Tax=Oculatella sp. LEGE 06141 TaxID=1828648 RepID=UPI00187F9BD5|nr:hypothetical protein [Oculatella sp. LEGE 06141]MBE9182080.1 hypothetical protein [Oculatella sp. LEGE 06141]